METRKAKRMDTLGSGMVVIGHLTISGGVGLLLPAAGLIVLGVGCLALGLLICRRVGEGT